MGDKDERMPCAQEGRITEMEVSLNHIESLVERMANETHKMRDNLTTRLDEHAVTLYGDRDVVGVVSQMKTLEELNLALKGYGKEPGLVAVISDLSVHMHEWDDAKKWMFRLVLGEVIVALLAVLAKLV